MKDLIDNILIRVDYVVRARFHVVITIFIDIFLLLINNYFKYNDFDFFAIIILFRYLISLKSRVIIIVNLIYKT